MIKFARDELIDAYRVPDDFALKLEQDFSSGVLRILSTRAGIAVIHDRRKDIEYISQNKADVPNLNMLLAAREKRVADVGMHAKTYLIWLKGLQKKSGMRLWVPHYEDAANNPSDIVKAMHQLIDKLVEMGKIQRPA